MAPVIRDCDAEVRLRERSAELIVSTLLDFAQERNEVRSQHFQALRRSGNEQLDLPADSFRLDLKMKLVWVETSQSNNAYKIVRKGVDWIFVMITVVR